MGYTVIPPDAKKIGDAGFVWKIGRRWHASTPKRAKPESFATEKEATEALTKKSHAKKEST